MDNLDEGDILPNPDEAIEYENTMNYNEGEEIMFLNFSQDIDYFRTME